MSCIFKKIKVLAPKLTILNSFSVPEDIVVSFDKKTVILKSWPMPNNKVSYTSPLAKKGRKKGSYWKRNVLLLNEPQPAFMPTPFELDALQKVGMGRSQQTPMINRHWTIKELDDYMCRLYPKIALKKIGFTYARCDRQRVITLLRDITTVQMLEDVIKASNIILIPHADIVCVPEVPTQFTLLPGAADPITIKKEEVEVLDII